MLLSCVFWVLKTNTLGWSPCFILQLPDCACPFWKGCYTLWHDFFNDLSFSCIGVGLCALRSYQRRQMSAQGWCNAITLTAQLLGPYPGSSAMVPLPRWECRPHPKKGTGTCSASWFAGQFCRRSVNNYLIQVLDITLKCFETCFKSGI